MRTEFVTTMGAAIAGFVVAFLICNIFFGEIEPVEVNGVGSEVNVELSDPDPEIFNYKALNPTVEVYVGDCDSYEGGSCVERANGSGS